MASRYKILVNRTKKEITLTGECLKGGKHKWGTDGAHSNEFCKKCFVNKPKHVTFEDEYTTDTNNVISLFPLDAHIKKEKNK